MSRVYIVTILSLIFLSYLDGQEIVTWVKSGNGSWAVPGNWETNAVPPVNRVPNVQDTVIIEHDSVVIPAGFNAFARRVILGVPGGSGTGLGVLANASLDIDDQWVSESTSNAGLHIQSASFYNNGIVNINDSEIGILVEEGTIDNLIEINIQSCETGMSNNGTITNEVGANLKITNISELGVSNYGAIINYGTITCLQMKDVFLNDQFGIITDSLINEGLIDIQSINGTGFTDIAIIRNLGVIEMQNIKVGLSSTFQGSIIDNDGTWSMDEITDQGIIGSFEIVNDGTLLIEHFMGPGIMIGGTFTQNGLLILKHSLGTGPALWNDGDIDNYGTIDIDSTGSADVALINDNVLNNYFRLTINVAKDGFINSGDFNNPGGVLSIEEGTGVGIHTELNFNNGSGGLVEINSFYRGILVEDLLKNQLGGTIETSNITDSPLEVLLGGTVENDGIMDFGL